MEAYMRIVKNISNHHFKIGEQVSILTSIYFEQETFLCRNSNGEEFWVLSEELEEVE